MGRVLTNRKIALPCFRRSDKMSDLVGELRAEDSTVVLDPAPDFVVLVRWEVVGVAEHYLTKSLAHICRYGGVDSAGCHNICRATGVEDRINASDEKRESKGYVKCCNERIGTR